MVEQALPPVESTSHNDAATTSSGGTRPYLDSSDSMPLGSLEHVRTCDAYPLPQAHLVAVHRDSGAATSATSPQRHAVDCSPTLATTSAVDPAPFPLLPGEGVSRYGRLNNTGAAAWMTNYRLFVLLGAQGGFYNVPLTCIDAVETRDLQTINIYCKDGAVFCLPATDQGCMLWYKELLPLTTNTRKAESLFAFNFFGWHESDGSKAFLAKHHYKRRTPHDYNHSKQSLTDMEYQRLGFDDTHWRVTDANESFKLCASYPRRLIVPTNITDEQLVEAASFRLNMRFPVCVYRCKSNGAVLMRSAQPSQGVLGWRCEVDESILQTAGERTTGAMPSESASPTEPDTVAVANGATPQRNVLIMDARSFPAAWTNRWAKGGGYEREEVYISCHVRFQCLPNIHNIRTSFQQLRQLLFDGSTDNNFLASLGATQWFYYLSQLIVVAVRAVKALSDGRSVLVHCSDGWDRTTQVVALAKLLLDPHYRTVEGFIQLIELEWVQFGHKFADRCYVFNGDVNERSPVFLQWLDATHQIVEQFPDAFEFNSIFLVKLAQHVYSSLFGTFISNSLQDMEQSGIDTKTLSVWALLHEDNETIINLTYKRVDNVLWPKTSISHIVLWRQVYCDGSEPIGGKRLDSVHTEQLVNGIMGTSINGIGDAAHGEQRRAHSAESISAIGSIADVSSTEQQTTGVASSLPRTSSEPHLLASSAMHSSTHQVLSSTEDDDARIRTFMLPVEHATPSESTTNGILTCNEPLPYGVPAEEILGENSSTPLPYAYQNGHSQDLLFALSDMDDEPATTRSPNTATPRREGATDMLTSTTEISDSSAAFNVCINNYSTPSLRRSPSETSLRTQTITKFLDGAGLVRRIDEQQQNRLIDLLQQRETRCDVLERELAKVQAELIRMRRSAQLGTSIQADEERQVSSPAIVRVPRPLRETRASGGGSDTSWEAIDGKSPIKWWPDEQVTHCMACDHGFSTILRRHHCRACGKVFCAECTRYQCTVPSQQHYKPVRVCKHCYTHLTAIPDARACAQEEGGDKKTTSAKMRLRAS